MNTLDRKSPTPLSDQIEAQLQEQIASGRLLAGARLVSMRRLASQLGVSVQTVVVAYDKLAASGAIESRGTSGFFVCGPREPLEPEDALLEASDEQDAVWLVQQANDQRAGMLLVGSGTLPAAWLQDAVPASCLQRAMARSSAGLASRCPPQGLPELRAGIAHLLRGQGLSVDPNRLLTTLGSTQAIDLICRAFLKRGDAVLVEDPGYFLMFDRLRRAGVRVVPVARRPDGLDLEQLEAACREERPRLLFMQAVLHNPTGWGSSPANLHRVLSLAQRHGVLIAEDDAQGHFHAGHATRLAALAGLEQVIYYSSFCKAVSPALRVGYMAAEPTLLKALMREKIHAMMTMPALNEYVMLEVLAAGRWRKHLDRLHGRLDAARLACASRLSEAGMRFEHAGEGLFLWGRVPDGVDVELLAQDALRNKIVLARGSAFGIGPTLRSYLRFNAVSAQHPRLAAYLGERFKALAGARALMGVG